MRANARIKLKLLSKVRQRALATAQARRREQVLALTRALERVLMRGKRV